MERVHLLGTKNMFRESTINVPPGNVWPCRGTKINGDLVIKDNSISRGTMNSHRYTFMEIVT